MSRDRNTFVSLRRLMRHIKVLKSSLTSAQVIIISEKDVSSSCVRKMTWRDRVRGARDGSSETGASVLAKQHNVRSRARSLLVGGAFRACVRVSSGERDEKKKRVKHVSYPVTCRLFATSNM